ncbi:hypothetical protein CEXT_36471 [Caerostris extrusa]|uniref:Uncharacterized protein n=1 Tax=Caerostris extrusa TaxID=172846 RepID=A0AAV4V264_CAEEX|nr:hypothetical protein CEXT_36471 [Caerostris extrusa]
MDLLAGRSSPIYHRKKGQLTEKMNGAGIQKLNFQAVLLSAPSIDSVMDCYEPLFPRPYHKELKNAYMRK